MDDRNFGGTYGSVEYVFNSCKCGFVPVKGSTKVRLDCVCEHGPGSSGVQVQKSLTGDSLLAVLLDSVPEQDYHCVVKMLEMLLTKTRAALEHAIVNTKGFKYYMSFPADRQLLQDAAIVWSSISMSSNLVKDNIFACFKRREFRQKIVKKLAKRLSEGSKDWSYTLRSLMVQIGASTIIKNVGKVKAELQAWAHQPVEACHMNVVEYIREELWGNDKMSILKLHPKTRIMEICRLFIDMNTDRFQNEVCHAHIISSLGCGPTINAVYDKECVYCQEFAGRSISTAISHSMDMSMGLVLGNVFLRSSAMAHVGNGIFHNDLSTANVCITTGRSDTIAMHGRTYTFEGLSLKFIDCGLASSEFYKKRSPQDIEDNCLFPNCIINSILDKIVPENFLAHIRDNFSKSLSDRCSSLLHAGTMRNMLGFKYNDFIIFCVSVVDMVTACNASKYDLDLVWSALELVLSAEFRNADPAQCTQSMMNCLRVPWKEGVASATCDLSFNIEALQLTGYPTAKRLKQKHPNENT